MTTEQIHTAFGVPPATLFDWSKPGHKKHHLAELLKALDIEEAESLMEKAKKIKKHKPMMLLSTVNCSIGDKSKHFTLTALKQLFYKKGELDAYEKYALKTIKREAMPSEIEEFVQYYKIPKSRVAGVLGQ